MGRPVIYDRDKTTTLRFYISKQAKRKIKAYAAENDTTIQEIYDEITKRVLAEKGIDINE